MTSYKPRETLAYTHALYSLLESPLQEYDHGQSILNTHKISQLVPCCEDPMATSGPRTVGKEAADGLYESSQAPSTRLDAYLPASEWLCVYLSSSHTIETNRRFIDDDHVAQLQAVYVVYVVSSRRTHYQCNCPTICNASIPAQDIR